jgi:hypothetical protein
MKPVPPVIRIVLPCFSIDRSLRLRDVVRLPGVERGKASASDTASENRSWRVSESVINFTLAVTSGF